jgi:general secretion pathway protein G
MRAVRNNPNRRRRAGFSLMELLIVLAIIGLIAAMVVPNLIGRQQQANIDITKQSIHSLEQALKLYAAEHNAQYPEGNSDALTMLIQPMDRNNQPLPAYIEKIPTDAWGNPLSYEFPSTKGQTTVVKPAIWSYGPDGKDDNGSNDDLNNWVIEAP